jgi:phosphomannomutase
VDAILALPFVLSQVAKLRARKWRVALDTVCGAGGPVMADVLTRLGCEIVVHLHSETSGRFPRPPEPVPENLAELGQAVRTHHCDMGVAVDPDVDRCVLLDATGAAVGEEYTLAMAVHYMVVTEGRRGAVVKNLSSSRVTDDIVRPFGCAVIATPVGEIHVAQAMLSSKAVIGGEGNGGVLLPEIHLGRDAPVAAALILCFLGERPSVAEAKATLPQYHIVKLKAAVPRHWDRILEHMKARYVAQGAQLSTADGVRIDTKEGWVHLRKSNTEPIYRVIGEFGSDAATSHNQCQAVIDEVNRLDAEFDKM